MSLVITIATGNFGMIIVCISKFTAEDAKQHSLIMFLTLTQGY